MLHSTGVTDQSEETPLAAAIQAATAAVGAVVIGPEATDLGVLLQETRAALRHVAHHVAVQALVRWAETVVAAPCRQEGCGGTGKPWDDGPCRC